jgi:hypothetical protein
MRFKNYFSAAGNRDPCLFSMVKCGEPARDIEKTLKCDFCEVEHE